MEVAHELVAGCRDGRVDENLDKIYAVDAVSVEAGGFTDSTERARHGLDAIREKHAWFDSAYETLEQEVSAPYPHGSDRFAVVFTVKMRNRETDETSNTSEVAIYYVSDGKITREEFFYAV
ncbi:MAG: nuclear transport factor 2 family protein [Pseudomonadota bacterium]